MDRTPSKTRAALWMSGWLAMMLVVAVAGREATREVNVFQLMAVRGVLGFVMLYPLIQLNGGFAVVKTARVHVHIARNLIHFGAQLGWFFALTLIRSARWWQSSSRCRSGPRSSRPASSANG